MGSQNISVDTQAQFADFMLTASRVFYRDTETQTCGNMSSCEASVVEHVGRLKELTMTQLAQELRVSKGAATQFVDKLIDRGLVERQQKEGDRKSIYIVLTGTGRKAHADVLRCRSRTIEKLFKPFSKSEVEVIKKFLSHATRELQSEFLRGKEI